MPVREHSEREFGTSETLYKSAKDTMRKAVEMEFQTSDLNCLRSQESYACVVVGACKVDGKWMEEGWFEVRAGGCDTLW